MKIANSNVDMESSRSYTRTGVKGGGDFGLFSEAALKKLDGRADGYVSSDEEDITNGYGKNSSQGNLKERLFSGKFDLGQVKDVSTQTDVSETFSMQCDLFYLLFRRLLYGGAFGAMGGSVAFAPSYNAVFEQRLVTYSETESTEFHASGHALTEDGRSIDFSVDIEMSRSYMEYMDVSIPISVNALLDPLVINVGSGITEISEQKFFFDLDADGNEEEISMPKKGSGFLSLDLNGDGQINDGSELFGTRSGDGFGDLRKYDSDNNGWIDENDDVFDRLKVWFKDENGEDVLLDLKEADIGAIYLGEAATEFSLNGPSFNRDALIRSTGFFLRESIGVGTIQHVDLAVSNGEKKSEETKKADETQNTGEILLINNPAASSNTSGMEERNNKMRIQRERRLEKEARRLRQENRRERQKEYEKKRLEEFFDRKERLEEELEEEEINRLFIDRMYEVV